MKQQEQTVNDLELLKQKTFYGNEKTPLAYVMGVMNMILHGIENPNISKQNTLTQDIRAFEEKDRFDIILANPPF
jgi:type I restriction enzyme M protein